MSDTAILALAGVVTTIVGFIFQAWQIKNKIHETETRLEATQVTHAEVVRARLDATAATVESKVLSAASQLKSEAQSDLSAQTGAIKDAITIAKQETTAKSTEALTEANSFNQKLDRQGAAIAQQGQIIEHLLAVVQGTLTARAAGVHQVADAAQTAATTRVAEAIEGTRQRVQPTSVPAPAEPRGDDHDG